MDLLKPSPTQYDHNLRLSVEKDIAKPRDITPTLTQHRPLLKPITISWKTGAFGSEGAFSGDSGWRTTPRNLGRHQDRTLSELPKSWQPRNVDSFCTWKNNAGHDFNLHPFWQVSAGIGFRAQTPWVVFHEVKGGILGWAQ